MTGGPAVIAMFPLGSVLLPTMVIPLHVFEDRYREMMRVITAGDGEPDFGVAMIERGSEVGGGDARARFGCVARVLDAEEQPDGRWHVVAVGTRRIEVVRWLNDEPYPRADVRALDEPPVRDVDDGGWTRLELEFRDLLDRIALRGSQVPAGIELDADPSVATYQMAAVGPFGTLDRYRVLRAVYPEERRDVLFEEFDGLRIILDGK